MSLSEQLEKRPALKKLIHWMLVPAHEARPRRWVSWFVNPFVHQQHRRSTVRRSARMDILPFRKFSLGERSVVEAFSVINNGVGDVCIGDRCTIGISSVVIGPVEIRSDVILAQHVVLSGLNHSYEDISRPIHVQPVTTAPIIIEEECWLGANVVVTAGVRIGRHSVVAGGSVVTKDVPPYCVVGGNPARILKRLNPESGNWERASGSGAG